MSSDENSENIIYGCGSNSDEHVVSKLNLILFVISDAIQLIDQTDDNSLITHDE